MFELYIDNNGKIQMPSVVDGVRLKSHRVGAPAVLTFEVMNDEALNFAEGNAVRLTVDGENMFFGFVFKKRRDKRNTIKVTACDQMRYLKNKDTYAYTHKTATDVLRMVAANFELQLGDVAQTSYVIASREEADTTGFDAIYNALDLDLTNTGNMYVLYDDFGKLTLKSLENMKVNLLIDEETGENFDFESSIDDSTYNRIKLTFENSETGHRDVYVVQDGNSIDRWGVLQRLSSLQEGENGAVKAAAMLDLFNAKTRKLKIQNALGDTRIRAGSMPIIKLNLGDVKVQNHMLVEVCTHHFSESEHWMDLTLRGGELSETAAQPEPPGIPEPLAQVAGAWPGPRPGLRPPSSPAPDDRLPMNPPGGGPSASSVTITAPSPDASFVTGQSIEVRADIWNAAEAELSIGRAHPLIGPHRIIETRRNFATPRNIVFRPHTFADGDVGDVDIHVVARDVSGQALARDAVRVRVVQLAVGQEMIFSARAYFMLKHLELPYHTGNRRLFHHNESDEPIGIYPYNVFDRGITMGYGVSVK